MIRSQEIRCDVYVCNKSLFLCLHSGFLCLGLQQFEHAVWCGFCVSTLCGFLIACWICDLVSTASLGNSPPLSLQRCFLPHFLNFLHPESLVTHLSCWFIVFQILTTLPCFLSVSAGLLTSVNLPHLSIGCFKPANQPLTISI